MIKIISDRGELLQQILDGLKIKPFTLIENGLWGQGAESFLLIPLPQLGVIYVLPPEALEKSVAEARAIKLIEQFNKTSGLSTANEKSYYYQNDIEKILNLEYEYNELILYEIYKNGIPYEIKQMELIDQLDMNKSIVSIKLEELKESGKILKIRTRRGRGNIIRLTEEGVSSAKEIASKTEETMKQSQGDMPMQELPIPICEIGSLTKNINMEAVPFSALEVIKFVSPTLSIPPVESELIKAPESLNFRDLELAKIAEVLKKRIDEKRADTKEKIIYELLKNKAGEMFQRDIRIAINMEKTFLRKKINELKNEGWIYVKNIIDHSGQKNLIGLNMEKIEKEGLSFMKISNEEQIENLLQEGDFLQSEIASKLGIHIETTRRTIKKMVQEGIVTAEFINPSKKMVCLAKNDIQEKVAEINTSPMPIKKKETPITITPDANFGVLEEQYELSDEQKFVLRIILKNPKGLNQTVIGKKTGFDTIKIREILPILMELGLVRIERHGRENLVFSIREKIEEVVSPEEINKDKVEKAVAKAVSYLVAGKSFKIANLFSICMIGKEYFDAVIEAIKIEFPVEIQKPENFMECLLVPRKEKQSNPKKIETIKAPLKKLGPSLAEIALDAEKELEQDLVDLLRGNPMDDEEIIRNLSKVGKTINPVGIHRMFNRINNNGGPKIEKEIKEEKIYYKIISQ